MRTGGEGGRFAANLALLEAREPSLAALLAETPFDTFEVLPTPAGPPSLRSGGLLLHSAYDPRGEADRIASSAIPPGADTAIVLGMGLGYGVEAALAVPGIERVIVCEAEPSRLAAALDARDLAAILDDDRLGWLVGGDPDAILIALDELGTRKLGLYGQRAIETAAPAWYAEVRAAADRFLAKEAINENTLRRFGRLWVRNIARNAGRFPDLPGIRELEGRFSGLPALVLAAGPSLDEVLPHLGALRDRLLLIAVDTSLRSLLAGGVEPDFIVVVDPQYWNWRHLADLDSPSSLLVSEPAVYHPVLRWKARAAFLAASLFPLGRSLGGEGRGLLGAGGSVATSAWDLARYLGAAPIFMAGLDLSYPAGKTHARASLFEQRSLASGTRLRPASSAQAAVPFGAPSSRHAANCGGTVLADQRMRLYAWWFESRLARKESPPTRTLSSRGVVIPGMAFASVGSLLELPSIRDELELLLDEAAAIRPPPEAREAFSEALRGLAADLEGIARLAEQGVADAREARGIVRNGGDPRPALRRLDQVDAGLHGSEARDIAGFLLPPIGEIVGETPRDLAESLSRSEALYAGVSASAREQLALLRTRQLLTQ